MDITRDIINTNPREHANFLEILFFSYTWKLFRTGYRKTLEVEDLYNPLATDTSSCLGNRLEKKWNIHFEKIKNTSEKPSLLRVLAQTFWLEYTMSGAILLMEYVFRLMQPLALGALLDYFSPESTKTQNEAFMFAAAVILLNIAFAIFNNQFVLASARLGLNIKTAACALIYSKTLKLNRTVLGKSTAGTISNLIANDVSRFDSLSLTAPFVWMGPLTLIVSAYFLWSKAGYAGLVGVIPILIVIPLQGYLGKVSAILRLQTAFKTDTRIRLMDEIISGIRVIKMYAWEKPFAKIIKIARQVELNKVIKMTSIRGLFMMFNLFTSRVALFSSLVAIALTNQEFTTADAFVFMSYFNILANAMSTLFVRGISELAESLVSIKRVETFLLYDEFDESTIIKGGDSNVAIQFSNVSTKWNQDDEKNALTNITVSVSHGTLLGVIGPVGCGKSSFLQTIMGELSVTHGTVEVNGLISYTSQEAWIFPATIRQNIIFNSKFDKERYNEVIKVCALKRDLAQFQLGDCTLVGERGIALSGGQKARVSLARAIYRDVDIYLLDDPLSAVDVAVGKYLYEKCINGFLAKKTRILVTHQVHHLKNLGNIIILQNGNVDIQGSFDQLLQSGNYFAANFNQDSESMNEEQLRNTSPEDENLSLTRQVNNLSSLNASNLTLNEKEYTVKELQEESSKGKVSGSLFLNYIFAGNNYFLATLVFLLFVFSQALASVVDYYVSYWTEKEEQYEFERKMNSTVEYSRSTYLGTYTGLLVALLVVALIRVSAFYYLSMKNSKKMHKRLFCSVINSEVSFFENNPSSRILNRFTKDTGNFDEVLPQFTFEAVQELLILSGSLILVAFIMPYMLIPTAVIAAILMLLRRIYLKTSVNLIRLEGINCSFVFSHLSVTFNGLTTIRSYNAQKTLKKEFDKYQDLHSSAFFMFDTVCCAFGFFLDILCIIFTTITTVSFVLLKDKFSSADAGLGITQALALTGILQWAVRHTSELVNLLTSVERILEYINLPSEKQPEVVKLPSSKWPTYGRICFENVDLKYSEEGNCVLKDLNVTINSEEKVGIVGRTGAGKSSFISAILRLAIVEGEITIDDILTKDLYLQTLRSKISIIPQDPVLFSGTLRYNLDPFEQYSDDYLYKALEEVELKDSSNLFNKLEYQVLDRGLNYSVGQKQLICLARALVRNNKVLILDEATANVDPQTDTLIQKTIREKFVNCTVITVAHRLNTIMDSDRILVMDSGSIVEFDHPYVLLKNENGFFYKMVANTGSSMMRQLNQIAKNSFDKKFQSKKKEN